MAEGPRLITNSEYSRTLAFTARMDQWNRGSKIVGPLASRVVGVVVTPLTCTVDAVVHLIFAGGTLLVGVVVTPINFVARLISSKNLISEALALSAAPAHLYQALEHALDGITLPFIIVLDPARAYGILRGRISEKEERAAQQVESKKRELQQKTNELQKLIEEKKKNPSNSAEDKKALADKTDEVNRLQNQLNQLKADQVFALQNQVKALETEKADAEAEATKLEKQKTVRETEKQDIKLKENSLLAELQTKMREKGTVEANIRAQKKEQFDLEQQIAALPANPNAASAQAIRVLKQTTTKLEADLKKAESEKKSLDGDIQRVTKTLGTVTTEKASLETEIAALVQQISAAKAKTLTSETDIALINGQLQALEVASDDVKKEQQKLKDGEKKRLKDVYSCKQSLKKRKEILKGQ